MGEAKQRELEARVAAAIERNKKLEAEILKLPEDHQARKLLAKYGIKKLMTKAKQLGLNTNIVFPAETEAPTK